jgi:hypothetical protein
LFGARSRPLKKKKESKRILFDKAVLVRSEARRSRKTS